jgi:glycosyltransferase involved in cell wall biosynthesis
VTPLVSAVVTTVDRPHLVGRAVRSALAQTLADLEVIVVVDGPDPATERTLAAIDDRRLHVALRPRRGGQGAALNAGIGRVRGEWTALLDDDDAWLPTKLERQLEAAASSPLPSPIVGCRFVARHERGDVVWPGRRPRPGEPLCEYLFCRHRLRFGEGILPTSVLLAPTALWRAVPMTEGLPRHGDLDWLVRAARHPTAGLALPPDETPLAVWEMRRDRPRMSNAHDWRSSLAWIDGRRDLVTARAYAGFLLTWISHSARCQRDPRAFATLVRRALRHGRPSAVELLIHAGIWALPPELRAGVGRRATIATPEPTP